MNKVAIYTCIIGGYDEISHPPLPPEGIDFICFVAKVDGMDRNGLWQIRELPQLHIDDARTLSRYPKFLPHILLPEYDYSLWMDANVVIKSSEFYDMVADFVRKGELFAAVCHPLRDDVYEEAEACIRIGRSRLEDMIAVSSYLIENKYPRHTGLTENNILFRSHNNPNVIAVDSMWNELFTRFPFRDQLLLGLCLFRNGLRASYILPEGMNVRNCPMLDYKSHKSHTRKVIRIFRQIIARTHAYRYRRFIIDKLYDTLSCGESLAVVIPAYKGRFFRQTLNSLSEQTDKRFHVYVGDDASKDDIKGICEEYSNKLNISYVRFEENLGGRDLVAHWARCVALAKEDWVWLFSDDDVAGCGCVDAFYKFDKTACDLVHFNVDVVDVEGNVLEKTSFPKYLSAKEFIKKRFGKSLRSYAVEYVFRREAWLMCGGFVNFDLAWNSDDATWIRLSSYRGIHTIDGAKVQWRRSGDNITSLEDAVTSVRKIEASLSYLRWLKAEGYGAEGARLRWFVDSLFRYRNVLTCFQIRYYMEQFAVLENNIFVSCFEKIYYSIKSLLRNEGVCLSYLRQKTR